MTADRQGNGISQTQGPGRARLAPNSHCTERQQASYHSRRWRPPSQRRPCSCCLGQIDETCEMHTDASDPDIGTLLYQTDVTKLGTS